MNMHAASWLQTGIAVLGAVIGTAYWTGTTTNDVQAAKAIAFSDHEKVISQEQELKDIKDNVDEIKRDVKHLLEGKH